MSGAIIILAERCNFCSRQLAPSDLMLLSSGQRICHRCWEKHVKSLDMLNHTVDFTCTECGSRGEERKINSLSSTRSLKAVHKDGIIQFLCDPCALLYTSKRLDIYGDTEYALRNKIG